MVFAEQGKYDAANNSFADDTTAAVLEAVKNVGDAGGLNEKQLKQLAMPFAKYKMDEATKGGAQVRPLQRVSPDATQRDLPAFPCSSLHCAIQRKPVLLTAQCSLSQ
jgi:hypothetical protein